MSSGPRQRRKCQQRRRRQRQRKDRSIRLEGLEPRVLLAANLGGDRMGPLETPAHSRFAEVDRSYLQQATHALQRHSSAVSDLDSSRTSDRWQDRASRRGGRGRFHFPKSTDSQLTTDRLRDQSSTEDQQPDPSRLPAEVQDKGAQSSSTDHDVTQETSAEMVSETGVRVEYLSDGSIVCYPEGDGPFPAILYNHGGKGEAVGGDLEGTCLALAEEGYVVRAEQRPASISLEGQLDDVLSGLDALLADPLVDTDQVGIMGFSRGGLLSLQAAIERPDDIDSVLLMAPAHGRNSLAETLQDVSALSAPVQVFVAENDTHQADHVQLSQEIFDTLTEAGKEVDLTIYPEFGDDGHELFFEVREPYWSDAVEFFSATLVSENMEQVESASLQLDHEGSHELAVGTHRPEIHLTPDGELLLLVVQPGEDPEGAGLWKHQGYHFSESMEPLADPFMVSQITDEFGEPADHRAIIVDDQLVVVYQSNVYEEDARSCAGGPAESCALSQSLMLARFSLEGEELFRGAIVANVAAEEFSVDSFPDHALLWDDGTLIITTGSQGNSSITFREVDIEDASVLATYRVDTGPAGIPSAIGNSLLRTESGLYLFSYVLAGPGGQSALVISQLGDDYQPTQVATLSVEGEEWTFPTGVIQYQDYLLVGYLSRDGSGSKDIEENAYQPRLLILDQDFNEVDNVVVSNDDGFAHVHPTIAIQDETLYFAWSKRTTTGPQVQVEEYSLSLLENLLAETDEDGQEPLPEGTIDQQEAQPSEELAIGDPGIPGVDIELDALYPQSEQQPAETTLPTLAAPQQPDWASWGRLGEESELRQRGRRERNSRSADRRVSWDLPSWDATLLVLAAGRSVAQLHR